MKEEIKSVVDAMTPEEVTDALEYIVELKLQKINMELDLYRGLVSSLEKERALYQSMTKGGKTQ